PAPERTASARACRRPATPVTFKAKLIRPFERAGRPEPSRRRTMYPGTYAAEAPDRVAAVMAGTGETLSYGDLERRSVQLAHVLHEAGLRPGDVGALLTENNRRAFEVYWAALRSGLYITAVNWHLKPDEVAYIVNDSGATAMIVSAEQAPTAEAITGLTTGVKLRLPCGARGEG